MAAETLKRCALCAGWVGAAAVTVASACGGPGRSAPEGRPASEPSMAQVVASMSDPPDALAASVTDEVPSLSVVLDDPRLAVARERVDARDDFAAALEVDRVRATVALDARSRCEWDYVSGRLHASAGNANDAAAAFDRVAVTADGGAPCTLASYARLREAEALVRAGRCGEATICARNVGDDIATGDEVQLTLADALSCKGDRAAAVAIWRSFLAANPRGVRWIDVSIQLATALLDGIAGPREAAAAEAIDRTTRVLVESPAVAAKLAVAELRKRAGLASKEALRPLTAEDLARQAQAWLDASQPKRARETADDALASIPKGPGPHRGAACAAAIVRAQATPHAKLEERSAAWGVAIGRCEGEEALVSALYSGGRASASAHHDAEALSRFAAVESRFPQNRLADDARFRGAMVLQEEGDEGRALAMLTSLPDAYPDGDMGSEALFHVALAKLEAHDFEAARGALDRALVLAPSAATGRRADYFRARVAELEGTVEDAKHRYVALVADAPLDYYMLLAYARLRALDDALARTTLEMAIAREAGTAPWSNGLREFASPAFRRFVSLLEVGEVDAARQEASGGGLLAEGLEPEVSWTVGWLYDHAGAPELGHAFARGRTSHWPSGRWKLPWQVAFPRAWDALVTRESEASGIPSPLTWAIMREESAFNPEAKSVASAVGLMQLMAGTARLVARDAQIPFDEAALHRPDVSIVLGTRLLSTLRASFPGHPAFAIAAYNGGSSAVRRWLVQHGADDFDVFVERIPFEETRNYVKHVLSSEAAYAYLYAPAALDEILTLPARLIAPSVVASP